MVEKNGCNQPLEKLPTQRHVKNQTRGSRLGVVYPSSLRAAVEARSPHPLPCENSRPFPSKTFNKRVVFFSPFAQAPDISGSDRFLEQMATIPKQTNSRRKKSPPRPPGPPPPRCQPVHSAQNPTSGTGLHGVPLLRGTPALVVPRENRKVWVSLPMKSLPNCG